MKNFKKVLAVLTAVSAMAATTSAFAANEAAVAGDVAGTYVADSTGAYKLTVTTPAAAKAGEDMTLLVLTEGALADEAVADSEILYIDQGIVGTDNFEGLGLKDEIINNVTTTGHIVKVGYYDADGNFAIAEGTISVTAVQNDITVTFKVGDVNKADGVNGTDANYILSWLTGGSASVGGDYSIGEGIVDKTGATTVFGDVNGADGVNGTDANYILSWLTGGSASVGAAAGIGQDLVLQVPAK